MSQFEESVERAERNGLELKKKSKNVSYTPAYHLTDGSYDYHIGNLFSLEGLLDRIEENDRLNLVLKYASELDTEAPDFLKLCINKDWDSVKVRFPDFFQGNKKRSSSKP